MTEKKQKIDAESAELEFLRFAEEMELDVDEGKMGVEDRKVFLGHKHTLVRAIQSGHVTVGDRGELTIALRRPLQDVTSLTIKEPTGSTFLAADAVASGREMGKMLAMMANIADVDPSKLGKLANRDFKVCKAITLLFL